MIKPTLLLPVKLETRYVGAELWVRIFPDKIFLQQQFETVLSEDEIQDREEWTDLQIKLQASDSEEHKNSLKAEIEDTWRYLVAKYGVNRSSWLIQRDFLVEPSPQRVSTPSFALLPNRFFIFLYKYDGQVLGPYPGGEIQKEPLEILSDHNHWLKDFSKAVRVGMGVKIPLPSSEDRFSKVIAIGTRNGEEGKTSFTQLLKNHQYTHGFSFIKTGTPTNNLEGEKTPHSTKADFDANGSYDLVVGGNSLEEGDDSFADQIRHALGIEIQNFKHIKNSEIKDQKIDQKIQQAVWPALGEFSLNHWLKEEVSTETKQKIEGHYLKYVSAKSHFPAIKIDNQPYGLLAVKKVRTNNNLLTTGANGQFLQNFSIYLQHLFESGYLDIPQIISNT